MSMRNPGLEMFSSIIVSHETYNVLSKPEVIKKIQEFYDICGLVRFGRAEAFEAKSGEIIKTVQAILKEDF